ncbi:MAG: glucose dehydrogenase [Chloroflexi bacterium]|nr:glucose dehydrogenase [Chloroflexota bacterium]
MQAQDNAARTAPPDPAGVQLVPVVSGLNRPLYLTGAGDNSGRLFVVEQGGKIWILKDGQKSADPFLDVSSLLSRDVFSGGYSERGLLGLAFSPDFKNNGIFFIDYDDTNGNTVIARYHVSADNPDLADPSSATTFLTQQQPYANHNGGQLAFGPDGYLYIAFGDGGSAGDPQNHAQDLSTWLGKILRIDVSGDSYTVPADNPFVNTQGAQPEIWAYGLRNPWRFSFDKQTGDLYIGDVGQNQWEEVDFQPAGDKGGENYGWNLYEGLHPYSGAAAPTNMTLPVAEYAHTNGIAITSGYVYRGTKLPDLVGAYFYGDYGTGTIWSLYRDASAQWQSNVFIKNSGSTISSFGQGDDGELYIANYGGSILSFEPAS